MWTAAAILQLLKPNDRAVARGIVAIWRHQTASEQASHATYVENGVGFSASDAKRGSGFAKFILRGGRLEGVKLDQARVLAIKYRRQLLTIAQKSGVAAPKGGSGAGW